jgi:hypothetical protein
MRIASSSVAVRSSAESTGYFLHSLRFHYFACSFTQTAVSDKRFKPSGRSGIRALPAGYHLSVYVWKFWWVVLLWFAASSTSDVMMYTASGHVCYRVDEVNQWMGNSISLFSDWKLGSLVYHTDWRAENCILNNNVFFTKTKNFTGFWI